VEISTTEEAAEKAAKAAHRVQNLKINGIENDFIEANKINN